MMQEFCLWCGRAFSPRLTGGSPQRFCAGRCRNEFHDAARRWAIVEVTAGRLSTTQLASAPKHSINADCVGQTRGGAG